jgi:hypothetical protein
VREAAVAELFVADVGAAAVAAPVAEAEDIVPPPLPVGGRGPWRMPGGFIIFDADRHSLNAHCTNPLHKNVKNPCRLNRTVFAGVVYSRAIAYVPKPGTAHVSPRRRRRCKCGLCDFNTFSNMPCFIILALMSANLWLLHYTSF